MAQLELNVFISSPGDVGLHRDTVQDAIEHINNDPLVKGRARLTSIRWDRDGYRLPMSANHTPQWSISEHLPSPGDCDLTIVLFWSRIGTPLPQTILRSDASSYPSGTVWELEHARNMNKPVWIYRKTHAPMIELDDPGFDDKRAQFARLDDYLSGAANADGSLNFGINRFENDEELRTLLHQHLRWFVQGSLQSAVDGAVNAAAALAPPAEREAAAELLDLGRYPIGPMIRDADIWHLAMMYAEILFDQQPQVLFAKTNARLAAARKPHDPELRLSEFNFSAARGSRYFWEDVLHWAAMQGPRMLAAVLGLIRSEQVDDAARIELGTLIKRVNSYV